MSAKKFDKGKTRWDLLPFREIEEVAEVLTYGAAKYGANNWKRGIDWDRLFAATLRHMSALKTEGRDDPESGKKHLAHAVCNLLFMMYFDNEKPPSKTLMEIFEGDEKEKEFDDVRVPSSEES